LLIGALTTIPLAFEVLGRHRASAPAEGRGPTVSAARSAVNEGAGQRAASTPM
jgi:hypothetical protein